MSVGLFVDVLVCSVDLRISFLGQCHTVLMTVALSYILKTGGNLVLFSQGCFGYLRSFLAPYMF